MQSKKESFVKIASYVKIVRPVQWLKNLMLFFPPFLGGIILKPGVLQQGVVPFAAFSLAASATYVFNDLCDRENDSHHPRKRERPLASGEISPLQGGVLCLLLLAPGLWFAHVVSPTFLLQVLAYIAISVAYSMKLKEIPLLDLFCISSGFLLRLQGGGRRLALPSPSGSSSRCSCSPSS